MMFQTHSGHEAAGNSMAGASAEGLVPRSAGLSMLAAVHFDALLRTLAGRPHDPLALDLKLPFCAVHCPFCEREVHVAASRGVMQDYVDGLMCELALLAQPLGSRRDVVQVRLGGGSANELSDSQLAAVVHALQRHWRLGADTEMSIQCDPRRTGQVQLQLMRGLGFRQVAFGVVDLDHEVQAAIGRCQSEALIDDVCELARDSGFEQVCLDLLVGLPHQTPQRWSGTLDRVIRLAPDRIALHCYRHRPEFVPGQRELDAADLPEQGECAEMKRVSEEALVGAGYVDVGDGLYVLDGDPLLVRGSDAPRWHNLIGFTAHRPVAVLGVGAGATSEIDGRVFEHEHDLAAWRDALRRGCMPVSQMVAGGPSDILS